MLAWLTKHFPDAAPLSGDLSGPALVRLLQAVQCKGLEWDFAIRRLRMVEAWLCRHLRKSQHRALTAALTVAGDPDDQPLGVGVLGEQSVAADPSSESDSPSASLPLAAS